MTLFLKLITVVASCALAVTSISAQDQNIADLLHKAESGDLQAQYDLAKAYIQGLGVAKDPKQGLMWLKKAADRGHSGAEVALGYMYQNDFPAGTEFKKNPSEAANWYRKAIRQRNNSAKDAEHAKRAEDDLSQMLAQGLISKKEADWRASEQTKESKAGKAAPFSLVEVEKGLSGGITNKRMADLVKKYKVNFTLTEAVRNRLTDQRANDDLLKAIAASKSS